MVLIGCKPTGRHTEQHDIFFGIAQEIKELIPAFKAFWPEAKGVMHVDGWREVTQVNGQDIKIIPKEERKDTATHQLYFVNLGGYKEGEFEEFHYKMVVAAPDKSTAISISKQTAFFKHTHFKDAKAHIDDKYGIDIDDMYTIEEILPATFKEKYAIELSEATHEIIDDVHLGYFKLNAL